VTGRRVALPALLVAAACLVGAQTQAPIFRTGVDVVLVDVSVRQGGEAVTGLSSADFELIDSGVPQTIESSALESIPVDLTLLLDTSGSTEGRLLERLKQGVLDTVQLLRPDDRVRVIAVQHVLNEVLPLQPARDPVPIDRLSAQGGTALYDGLAAVMMRPAATGRRQLIVAYTDGDDASSITSPSQALEIALHAEAVVHVVVPVEDDRSRQGAAGGPAPARVEQGRAAEAQTRARAMTLESAAGVFPNESTLRAAAGRTGGRVFVVGLEDSISAAFRDVLDDYRRSYLLRYTPQGVPREGWHDIVVRVKKPGAYEVRARRGWGG
jgi:VWFA-related protein